MRQSLIVALAMIATLCGAAEAQEAIRNRAVRILGADTPPAASPAPGAPAGEGAVVAPAGPREPAVVQNPPVLSEAQQRADNPSGIKIELLPGEEVAVGDKMAVRISAEKPGYLVVIDVDSSGRLTQVYPNTHSLALKQGAAENANLIARGKPRLIPDPKDKSNFEFVASPPYGVGMLVAILSDKPVQMIDLPDVPGALAGQIPALEYVRETTRSLKILPATDAGSIQQPKWSFATKFYVIK